MRRTSLKGNAREVRGNRNLPFDAKSTDRLVRFILALPETSNPNRFASKEPTKIRKKPKQGVPDLTDLIHVHVRGSSTFGGYDREETRETMGKILSHPALQPLNDVAQIVASSYILQARLAYQYKTNGKYWVLDGIGSEYQYPLAIRARAFPCWKRQIRFLDNLSKKLRRSASQALRLEADTIVSSHPEKMPAELILSAETALRKAIQWMQAFPGQVELRSKYREMMRPNTETESVGAVAYVLDRLYREHTRGSLLKVKGIECRTAELETKFLGQNIDYGPAYGCPAVRLQIRALKRSNARTAVDARIARELRMVSKLRETARRNDPSEVAAAFDRLMNRLDRHVKASHAWQERTETRLNEDLRRAIEATTYADELSKAIDTPMREMQNYTNLGMRWTNEYGEHLNALKTPELDLFEYGRTMRKWMRQWESLWDFPM